MAYHHVIKALDTYIDLQFTEGHEHVVPVLFHLYNAVAAILESTICDDDMQLIPLCNMAGGMCANILLSKEGNVVTGRLFPTDKERACPWLFSEFCTNTLPYSCHLLDNWAWQTELKKTRFSTATHFSDCRTIVEV